MADFEAAIAVVLQNEDPGLTGFVSHDDGGATRWGISQRAYPALDIEHLPLDRAKEIYRNGYWAPIHGDQIEDQHVAAKLLDMAVNMGVVAAVVLAQHAVGVKADGCVGPITIGAINATDPQVALADLRYASEQRYQAIADSDPEKYGQYLDGWLRRAAE